MSEVDEPGGGSTESAARLPRLGGARRRPAAIVVDVLAVVGLIGGVGAVLVGGRATIAHVDRVRRALGGEPPADGIDWVTLVAMVDALVSNSACVPSLLTRVSAPHMLSSVLFACQA